MAYNIETLLPHSQLHILQWQVLLHGELYIRNLSFLFSPFTTIAFTSSFAAAVEEAGKTVESAHLDEEASS